MSAVTRCILSEEPGQIFRSEAMAFQALPRAGHEQDAIPILGDGYPLVMTNIAIENGYL